MTASWRWHCAGDRRRRFDANQPAWHYRQPDASITTSATSAFTLNGNLIASDIPGIYTGTTSFSAANAATITGQSPLTLSAANHTILVDDSPRNVDLDIQAIIAGGAAANTLTKAGPGTLQFSQTTANTYTSTTVINEGVLNINKQTTTTTATSLVIGDFFAGVASPASSSEAFLLNTGTGGTFTLTINGQTTGTRSTTMPRPSPSRMRSLPWPASAAQPAPSAISAPK